MLELNPGAGDHEVFINIQITSAGVNVRDAAADRFQDFSRQSSVI